MLYTRSGKRQTGITSLGGSPKSTATAARASAICCGLGTLGRIEPVGRAPLPQRAEQVDVRQGRDQSGMCRSGCLLELGPQGGQETAVRFPGGGGGGTGQTIMSQP